MSSAGPLGGQAGTKAPRKVPARLTSPRPAIGHLVPPYQHVKRCILIICKSVSPCPVQSHGRNPLPSHRHSLTPSPPHHITRPHRFTAHQGTTSPHLCASHPTNPFLASPPHPLSVMVHITSSLFLPPPCHATCTCPPHPAHPLPPHNIHPPLPYSPPYAHIPSSSPHNLTLRTTSTPSSQASLSLSPPLPSPPSRLNVSGSVTLLLCGPLPSPQPRS